MKTELKAAFYSVQYMLLSCKRNVPEKTKSRIADLGESLADRAASDMAEEDGLNLPFAI